MSVKQMTTDEIRNDLETIAMTWPDGVPWQQVDRINALKTELKRRGESTERPAGSTLVTKSALNALNAMTTEDLEVELRKLSTRGDEASKDRFADVRFELRQRTKLEPERVVPPRPQTTPRALELPDDDGPAEASKKEADEDDAKRETLKQKRKEEFERRALGERERLVRKPAASVCGYTATAREDGTIILEYKVFQYPAVDGFGSVVLAQVMDDDQVKAFIYMISQALVLAKVQAADD